MKSNYKTIGELVERIDQRNINGSVANLIGVSIDKKFIPSVANVIGTDLTKYKVIERYDFAVSLMQVSRDGKIPIACQKEYEKAIMSPAYPIFRVKDTNVILPEYLEMWFMRDEFDREAAFIAVGGVRGSMPWEDFAKLKLPVPDIAEQKEIVSSYRAVTDRIALKQRINDNLEAQCSCILYNQYSADTSNGKTWTKYSVQDLINMGYIEAPMDGNHGEIHPKVSDYVSSGVPFIMANNLSDGFINFSQCAFITEEQAKTLRKGFAKPDDVLLTHKATLGRVAIVPEIYDYIILTPQVTYYRVKKGLSNVYLRYYFASNYFQSILESFAGGGSTRAYVGITKQCELPIYLPCESSMESISETLSKIERVRSINQTEIVELKTVRDAILSQLSSR